jgi:GTP-binding protein Era
MTSETENNFRSGFAALLGPANAGKSTLLNALIGRKVSIVSHKPQTTRNRILGVANREQSQIVFVDTPGFQAKSDRGLLSAALDASLEEGAEGVDVHVLVLDGARTQREAEYVLQVLARFSKLLDAAPQVVVVNKCDLLGRDDVLTVLDKVSKKLSEKWEGRLPELVPVSAAKGTGLSELCKVIERFFETGPRFFPIDMVTDQSEEFFISELIREKVYDRLHKEIPYSTAVKVERVDEDGELLRIGATILIERESQKPIVVGAQGKTIKSIGIASRKDLERVFGMQVDLQLHVRVERSWTKTKKGMGKAGYRL